MIKRAAIMLPSAIPKLVQCKSTSTCINTEYTTIAKLIHRASKKVNGGHTVALSHLLCLSIASNSSSSDRGEMPSTRNPGKLSEAVVSICISST
jgi:hypothetical protein